MSTPHPFGKAPPSLPPELEARLSAALSAELEKPPRPWVKDAALFVAVALTLFCLGCFVFHSQLSPFDVPTESWVRAVALLVVALIAGVAGLAPWPQRTSRPLVLGLVVGGTVLVTQALTMELAPFRFLPGCAVWELMCSALPAGVALVAAKQHAPRLSRAMVLGWAAGTASLAVMQLKCPHRDPGHLLVFHVLPLLLVVGATMLLRRRLGTDSYAP
jgi:hypothetical protein